MIWGTKPLDESSLDNWLASASGSVRPISSFSCYTVGFSSIIDRIAIIGSPWTLLISRNQGNEYQIRKICWSTVSLSTYGQGMTHAFVQNAEFHAALTYPNLDMTSIDTIKETVDHSVMVDTWWLVGRYKWSVTFYAFTGFTRQFKTESLEKRTLKIRLSTCVRNCQQSNTDSSHKMKKSGSREVAEYKHLLGTGSATTSQSRPLESSIDPSRMFNGTRLPLQTLQD